ncbi:unnamed protein product [Phaedon cochleariae]|uniref:peptidyl-tRNA hydrolase n=1 Tax=Phaedon cochleariae TaxID=80249 RepID=A0A9P0GNB7_PHACE|nr:unnamed protein product [Phaedon cochleariae]
MTDHWKPNEEYLHHLISMGFVHNVAIQALFCTDNRSIDEAVNYIFSPEETQTAVPLPVPVQNTENAAENAASDDESGDGDNEDIPYYKMTFVVNSSLKMGVGKIAAQVGHACLGLYRELVKVDKQEVLDLWEDIGEKKIVLKGKDDVHLMQLFEKAKLENIPCYLVKDAGHTQIAPGSVTVLSLFGLEEDVNKITGKLSLL